MLGIFLFSNTIVSAVDHTHTSFISCGFEKNAKFKVADRNGLCLYGRHNCKQSYKFKFVMGQNLVVDIKCVNNLDNAASEREKHVSFCRLGM